MLILYLFDIIDLIGRLAVGNARLKHTALKARAALKVSVCVIYTKLYTKVGIKLIGPKGSAVVVKVVGAIKEVVVVEEEPKGPTTEELLTEIRDLLKK